MSYAEEATAALKRQLAGLGAEPAALPEAPASVVRHGLGLPISGEGKAAAAAAGGAAGGTPVGSRRRISLGRDSADRSGSLPPPPVALAPAGVAS